MNPKIELELQGCNPHAGKRLGEGGANLARANSNSLEPMIAKDAVNALTPFLPG